MAEVAGNTARMPKSPNGAAMRRALPLMVILLAACSGKVSDDSPDAAPDARPETGTGMPSDKRLDATTAEERARLCDWLAEKFGGYGRTIRCPDGSVSMSAPANRAECVGTFPSGCPATVSQFEACVIAISRMDFCSAVAMPKECDPLRACGEEEPVPPEPIDAGSGF